MLCCAETEMCVRECGIVRAAARSWQAAGLETGDWRLDWTRSRSIGLGL